MKVADILNNSDRPLILSGHGVILDRAENILRKLAINYNIPVTMSLLGLGAFPTQHQLSLGFHGHTGSQVAGLAIQNCDVLLVVGSRLDIRQIGTVSNKFAPKAKIIRIEIDKEELKACRVSADFVLMGRSKTILHSLFDSLNKNKKYERQKWLDQIIKWKNQHKNYFSKGKKLKPQSVIEELNIQTEKEEVICVSGVGLHQQWTARHFDFDFPKRRWFTSGGHGAMGYDLPVAMGSQYCEQNKLVLCVVGDGSLQMNIQELATLIAYSLPVKLIVIDNHSLGIVSQFQNLNWNRDPTCGDKWNPDFAKIAKSYGMLSETVKKNEELSGAIKRILKSNGPALLHCIVDEAEEISPMLLAGQTLDQMWKK